MNRSTRAKRKMNIEAEVVTLDDTSDASNDTVFLDDSSDNDDTVPPLDPTPHTSNTIKYAEKEPSNEDIIEQNDATQSLDRVSIVDVSLEDYDYNLKLMRNGTFEQYKTTWRTKLSVALKDLLSELAKSGKSLVLTKRDGSGTVSLDGTPHSLNLDSGTILTAIVNYGTQQSKPTATNTGKTSHNPNVITLKLQDGQRKHLKEFQIGKQEPLGVLKQKYAESFNIDLNRMKLCFDGDPVDDQDTADSLDIEDECVIDVIVSS